jgi:hypothetical protein
LLAVDASNIDCTFHVAFDRSEYYYFYFSLFYLPVAECIAAVAQYMIAARQLCMEGIDNWVSSWKIVYVY